MPGSRSLYKRLTFVLVAICVALGVFQVGLALYLLQLYDHEATQKLNQRLAAHLVEQNLLSDGKQPDVAALEAMFDRQMRANPAIELYLLDTAGKVLASTAPLSQHVEDIHVDLAPISEFLRGTARFPLHGVDPRQPTKQRIFSAARIPPRGELRGYLYVILGSTEHRNIWDMMLGSYAFRVSLVLAAAALFFAGLTAFLVFRTMTRPLELLATEMEAFHAADFSLGPQGSGFAPGARADEIDRVRHVYHEMARRIAAYVDQLNIRDRQRRDLVANIVHDLKTPFTVIRGYLDTVRLQHESLDEAARAGYLATASKSAARLARMLDDLLELSKLDARERLPRKEVFSVIDLVHDVAIKFAPDAAAKGVDIRVDVNAIADQGAANVIADIGMIERVLDNLVRNAIAHTPRGGVIRLEICSDEARVLLRVTDSGSGIAEADLPHVFDRFYRAADAPAEAAPRIGLGLAISKRMLELHDRDITVESRLGEGACFSFSLDRANSSCGA